MIKEGMKLTFGVEFECVLAFKESLLREQFPKVHRESSIKKDINDQNRKALNIRYVAKQYQNEEARSRYNGWGLTFPTEYSDSENQDFFQKQLRLFDCRAYGEEVLSMAKTLLVPEIVRMDPRRTQDAPRNEDFSLWSLTHDQSLVGIPKEVLAQRLRDVGREIPASELEDWDSAPVELVSRQLSFEAESFTEIRRFMSRLCGAPEGDQRHIALTTEYCGLHVHVGLPHGQNFDLALLQHLAYLTVMYSSKDQFDSMFPANRRKDSQAAQTDLKSNLEDFLIDASIDSDRPIIPLSEVCELIFQKNMKIGRLAEIMRGKKEKNYMMNWKNMYDSVYRPSTNPLRTIEFRQHEGTLDAEATKWWTTFVVGLVRLAADRAEKYGNGWKVEGGEREWKGYDGEGYIYKNWDERMNIRDLFTMMELDDEGQKYFEGRIEKFSQPESLGLEALTMDVDTATRAVDCAPRHDRL